MSMTGDLLEAHAWVRAIRTRKKVETAQNET